ncbi:unnamed protein product [Rotaria magnacalcarata]|uniref:Uncharacterized protein n=1 Tax=Rotaria magnacalcarata TaxID=392030 RepID=A0A814QZT8_9BILA|nr:unnamed protein product [Rotaria magnacalcarata]CAF1269942.1 unnamed protein product [Rotaria magnacalcarata]CAF1989646.1 unnamed protein product [Rotaria magnacalcarata]CAF1993243.1 unnamed protein product [Rotaria magnacalcarata]CAF2050076.1 unnamed protein product [Rotaria magnacalcarata]
MLISTTALAFPFLYEIEDGQSPNTADNVDTQRFLKQTVERNPSLFRRNSPLCDYRLHFRPSPLASTLCSYRNNHKGDDANQINPFKYG